MRSGDPLCESNAGLLQRYFGGIRAPRGGDGERDGAASGRFGEEQGENRAEHPEHGEIRRRVERDVALKGEGRGLVEAEAGGFEDRKTGQDGFGEE